MAMISSPASADQSKTGQKLVEDGYQVMDEYELETYLVNRTVYTRVRKANGELSKSSYPSYHHESGKRWLKVKNKIYETAWGFEDGMACYEGYRTGKWGCLIWYIKGDSVIACNSKKKDCKYDQSESRDGDSEGLMN